MGRPVSPQQLPGSDPAGRHQRAAEEQPLSQCLLEGLSVVLSGSDHFLSVSNITSCPYLPVCLSVCVSAVPGGPTRRQEPVDQQDQGAPRAIREDQRDGESAPLWPIQSNDLPKKFAAAVYYNSCSQVLNKSHFTSVFFFLPPQQRLINGPLFITLNYSFYF